MKKIRKFHLFTTLVAAFLAGVTSFSEPLKLSAATQGAYLSEVIVITDNDIEKAKNDNYTVMKYPLGTQALRNFELDAGLTNTYLAYKTTNNANDAIHDMKFMNMTGGFDFATYDDYLNSVEDLVKQTTANLFVAIEGYRKYYNAQTLQGKYAHEALNIFRYDEYDGLNNSIVDGFDATKPGLNIKLGDLLLDKELIKDGNSQILVDIFMEANSQVLDTIYSVLNIANSYNDEGKSFLTALMELDGNYSLFADRTDLNDTFYVLSVSIEKIREDVNWYNNEADHKYGDFKDPNEVAKYSMKLLDDDQENQTNHANMWNDAVKESAFLQTVEYKGMSGKYNNLLDLIMDEEAESNEYYPLLGCMNPGCRATALLGIMDMLTNALLDEEGYMNTIQTLKEADPEVKDIIENEGISVFYNVDRALYRKGNVAMTTSAAEGAAKGDEAWKDIKDKRNSLNHKIGGVLFYSSIGLAGFAIGAGVGFLVARGIQTAALDSVEFYESELIGLSDFYLNGVKCEYAGGQEVTYLFATEAEAAAGQRGTVVSAAFAREKCSAIVQNAELKLANRSDAVAKAGLAGAVKVALAVTIAIAVIALIVTVVLFVLNYLKNQKPAYNSYTEIPGILCHYQPVYDVSDNGARIKGNNGYVYYYGATNPYSVATSAKFGNDDDGSKKLGENKRNVQDIYNWELGEGKSREWVCLYYTKDRRASYPITAKSLSITPTLGNTCEGASSFNKGDIEYNMNSVLVNNYYQDKNLKSYNKEIGETLPRYLHFTTSRKANYSTNVGSAVSNVATWGFVLIGLLAGFGGGIVTSKLISKKKKKEKEA